MADARVPVSALERLLNPRSIAVVGGKEAERVIEQCDKLGFDGPIWPVHPTRDQIRGRHCYRGVECLPGVPDAAYVAVNRERSVQVVASLAALGCGGAVSYAAGFAEVEHSHNAADGQGGKLQRELVQAASAMPLLGPNCYGFINALARVALWPDQHGATACERGVAIITQSSNIAISMTMQTSGLPISYVATVGNQAQLGLSMIAQALIEDDRVTALGLHIEGLDDPRAFEQLAGRAWALRKPIVILRVGVSDKARATALTHTASLTGSGQAFTLLLRRLGMASVAHIDTFVQTLLLMHTVGVPGGRDVLSLSCSGGEAALMADALEAYGLHTPPFDEPQVKALRALLGDLIHISNPFDYNTFIWGDWPGMTQLFSLATRGRFDIVVLVLDFPRVGRCDTYDWDRALEAFVAGVQASGAKAAVTATLPENLPEEVALRLIDAGVAPLRGIANALAAIDAAASVAEAWTRGAAKPILQVSAPVEVTPLIHDEFDAKALLRCAGVRVPRGWRVSDTNELDAVFHAHGTAQSAFVLKALGLAHKSEHGGVHLNLRDADAARAAMQAMATLSATCLFEEMLAPAHGVELLVGITRDPAAGLMLTLGAGGVLTEIMRDTAATLLPTTRDEIHELLGQLRIAPVLRGYRGVPGVDMKALVAQILAIAAFAEARHGTLLELDINPLIASPDECVAVDVLLIEEPTR